MNEDNAKDYLPLVQALAGGKVIQAKLQVGMDQFGWRDCEGDISFHGLAENYRIKPEPREIFLALDDEDLAYWDEARARSVAGPDGKVSRYREVIE